MSILAENEEKGRVYYSLVDRYGNTIKRGDMSLSLAVFIDAIQRIGFELLPEQRLVG